MPPPSRRRRRRQQFLWWWDQRFRRPGSPNLWLIIPLSIVGVLALAWVVGQFTLTDFTAVARNLVKTTYK